MTDHFPCPYDDQTCPGDCIPDELLAADYSPTEVGELGAPA